MTTVISPLDGLCSLNGRILPVAEATVHPLDRGFIFGDGVYEMVKILGGVPLLLEEHLARLEASLAGVAITVPGGVSEVARACRELLGRAEPRRGSLYIQVTRGVAERSHAPPPHLAPTLFILAREHPVKEAGQVPMRAATHPDIRWGRCDIKTTSLMATVMGRLATAHRGADEVLFTAPEGELREGGNTNLFVSHRGALETHPLDRHILPGITRRVVLELAAAQAIPVREEAPHPARRGDWDEAFLCGTLTAIQPLVELDGEPIGGGEPGPWTRCLAEALAAHEARLARQR